MLDQFYITIFKYYAARFGRRSISIALGYIIFLETAIILLIGAFFMAFATQMRILTMSLSRFFLIFFIVGLFVCFKNWLRYTNKKRHVLKAKLTVNKPVYLLWLLPIACIVLSIVFLQVL